MQYKRTRHTTQCVHKIQMKPNRKKETQDKTEENTSQTKEQSNERQQKLGTSPMSFRHSHDAQDTVMMTYCTKGLY